MMNPFRQHSIQCRERMRLCTLLLWLLSFIAVMRPTNTSANATAYNSTESFVDSCTEYIVSNNPDNSLNPGEFADYLHTLRCSNADNNGNVTDNCDETLSFHALPLALQINFALISSIDFGVEFTPPNDLLSINNLCENILTYLINLGWIETTGDLSPSAPPTSAPSSMPTVSSVPSSMPVVSSVSSVPSSMPTVSSVPSRMPTVSSVPSSMPVVSSVSSVPSSAPSVVVRSSKPSINTSNEPTESSFSFSPNSKPSATGSNEPTESLAPSFISYKPTSLAIPSYTPSLTNKGPTLTPTKRQTGHPTLKLTTTDAPIAAPVITTASPFVNGTKILSEDQDNDTVTPTGIILLSLAAFLLLSTISAMYLIRSRKKKLLYHERIEDGEVDIELQDKSQSRASGSINQKVTLLAAESLESQNSVNRDHGMKPKSLSPIPQFIVPREIYERTRKSDSSMSSKGKYAHTAMEAAIESGNWAAVASYARNTIRSDKRGSTYIAADSSISMSFPSDGSRTLLSKDDQQKSDVINAFLETNDWQGIAELAEHFNQNMGLKEALRLRGIEDVDLIQRSKRSSLSAQQSDIESLSSTAASEEFGGVVQQILRRRRLEDIRKRTSDLLKEVAPHEHANLDAILEQFEGSEEELNSTLTLLNERRNAENRSKSFYVHKRLSLSSATSSSDEDLSFEVVAVPSLTGSDNSFSSDTNEDDYDDLNAINIAIEDGNWDEVQRRASAMNPDNISLQSPESSSSRNSSSLAKSSILSDSGSFLVEQALVDEYESSRASSISAIDDVNIKELQSFMDNEDWDGLVAFSSKRNM